MLIISDEIQEMLNDFSRALGCGYVNLKVSGLSTILYLSHIVHHSDIGQGTCIIDNHICQASHMIYASTFTDEERKLLLQIGLTGNHLHIGGLAYTHQIIKLFLIAVQRDVAKSHP